MCLTPDPELLAEEIGLMIPTVAFTGQFGRMFPKWTLISIIFVKVL